MKPASPSRRLPELKDTMNLPWSSNFLSSSRSSLLMLPWSNFKMTRPDL